MLVGGVGGWAEEAAERARRAQAALRALAVLPWRGPAADAFAAHLEGLVAECGLLAGGLDGAADATRAHTARAAARAEAVRATASALW